MSLQRFGYTSKLLAARGNISSKDKFTVHEISKFWFGRFHTRHRFRPTIKYPLYNHSTTSSRSITTTRPYNQDLFPKAKRNCDLGKNFLSFSS